MKKKKIQGKEMIIVGIRALFFLLFPAAFSTAFSGVKYLFVQMGQRQSFQWNSFLLTLVTLLVVTMVFGRVFCGFACAFGSYGDFIYWIGTKIQKKRKKRPYGMPKEITKVLRYGKYIVLLGMIFLCFYGQSNMISENSPWTVFSRIQSLSLKSVGLGGGLLVLITVGMYFEERFFCRFLCPMGAVFSLLPVLPFAQVSRDREDCGRGCKACTMKCPAGIELPDTRQEDHSQMGECFACGKCVAICPKGNCQTGLVKEKEHLQIDRVIKALILFLVCYFVI